MSRHSAVGLQEALYESLISPQPIFTQGLLVSETNVTVALLIVLPPAPVQVSV
jgi:hypothetical protein